MKVAITTCEGRVCQRLDCADKLVVLDIRDGEEHSRQVLDLRGWPMHGRPARIVQLHIDELICGAVSSFDGAGFDNSNVRLIPGVTGPVEAAIQAVLSGTITPEQNYWKTNPDQRYGSTCGRNSEAPPDVPGED